MQHSISARLTHLAGNLLAPVRDPFSREIVGLPEASATEMMELPAGSTFELRAGMVRNRPAPGKRPRKKWKNTPPISLGLDFQSLFLDKQNPLLILYLK